MANFQLFSTRNIPATNTVNEAGGRAYRLTPRHALAQYALTGCLNQTYYSSAEEQLQKTLELLKGVPAEFIAKTAIYARRKGYMKDMPALLCAELTTRDWEAFSVTFDQVIDNGRMLRTFMQIMRSGVVGRKSLGSMPKRKVQQWLTSQRGEQLFNASVGQSPSLADVIKMMHPKPSSPEQEALFAYLLDRPHQEALLPETVKAFERFKLNPKEPVPDVPFQRLTSLNLTPEHWRQVARQVSWQTLRMNLNTFARHGVMKKADEVVAMAERLRDPVAIRKARVFPYQLLAAYLNADAELPGLLREALQDALELSLGQVPTFEGQMVYVLPDVSGSMSSPITGARGSATTKVRCIDVAGLVAAAVLRKNPKAEVIPFEQEVVSHLKLNARDSVLTNAEKLASVGGGGTNCRAPLTMLNRQKAKGELVIYVSDNESWLGAPIGRATGTLHEWEIFKQRNPTAKLVCIDLQPNAHSQAPERPDILNIGGFSDQVFELMHDFSTGALNPDHLVGKVEQISLSPLH